MQATALPRPVPLTVAKLSELTGHKVGSIRWALFHRQTNGLVEAGAVIKVGPKRLLIDPARYLDWLASHTETVNAAPAPQTIRQTRRQPEREAA